MHDDASMARCDKGSLQKSKDVEIIGAEIILQSLLVRIKYL